MIDRGPTMTQCSSASRGSTACRRAAEDKIRTAVLEDGILQQAQNNAENYFYRFFTEQLGYDSVEFIR